MKRLRQLIHFVIATTLTLLRRSLRHCAPSAFLRERGSTHKHHLRNKVDLRGPRRQLSTRYSLIVPCHNVEKYLDDFFHSLFSQSVDPECLEVIAVDDGSTDRTAQRIADWAVRFPRRIQYIFQHNQRVAAARNTGLARATGEWVSFPDPDDFFSTNYVEKVDEEVARTRSRPLSMVSCNLIFFKEAKRKERDSHPLRYRFREGRTILPADDLQDHMQLSAATAWFRRDLIEQHRLRFDSRIFPTFEDSHFVNRFLLLNPNTDVAFLKAPTYHYRKRSDGTSVLDNAKLSREWLLDSLRYGPLDLLRQADDIAGRVPRFIQRTVLYDVLWRFHHLIDHPERAAHLTKEEREEFIRLLEEIFAKIDCSTIKAYNLVNYDERHKVGLLGLMKKTRGPVTSVYVRQYDSAKRLMQFSYYAADPHNKAEAQVNDRAVPLFYVSRCKSRILDRTYVFEHYFWLPVGRADYVTVRVDQEICALKCGEDQLGSQATFAELEGALTPRPVNELSLPSSVRQLRHAATGTEAKNKYDGCWLLIDREDKADNNAEHLYRYLLSTGNADQAFYVLRTDSPDWPRLEAEGFRLIEFNSREHHIAVINAKFVICSDLIPSVLQPVPHAQIRDLIKYRIVFLQHGVIKDDISRWVNSRDISLFITSTPSEYVSIADPESDYKFSAKEVALTGLARHDSLLTVVKSATTIMIMPTWRQYLAGKLPRAGTRRAVSSSFANSECAVYWRSFLQSQGLRDIANRYGMNLVFSAHANLAPQIADLELPDYVHVCDPLTTQSLQPLFAQSAVLITDYSSVAFEFAYLDKPVIYYQFDAQRFFSGAHTSQPGYFDYQRDGFGPVCETEKDVLFRLESALSGTELSQYADRRHSAFPYQDGNCCDRIYQRILDMDEPWDNDNVIELGPQRNQNTEDAASNARAVDASLDR